jgi:hypothetical protein
MMSKTLTGLFDNYADAERAIRDLEAAGVADRDISIVANNANGALKPAEADSNVAEDAEKGAGIGAAVGGVGGLLAGLGLLAIPGLGPVVAAGWLASTIAGAVGGAFFGGAAGGLVGALTEAGVPEDDAHVYSEGVRRGGTLVTAKVDDDLVPNAEAILHDGGSVNVAARRSAYQEQGWSEFDPAAPEYTSDEVVRERERYQTF